MKLSQNRLRKNIKSYGTGQLLKDAKAAKDQYDKPQQQSANNSNFGLNSPLLSPQRNINDIIDLQIDSGVNCDPQVFPTGKNIFS